LKRSFFSFFFFITAFIQPCIFAEVPWQVPTCTKRLLLTSQKVIKAVKYSALIKTDLSTVPGSIIPESVHVFAIDSNGTKTVPSQFLPKQGELLLKIHPKSARAYLVYFNTGKSKDKSKTQMLPQTSNYVVTGMNYQATISGKHGHLSSLEYIANKKHIETLCKGIYWAFRKVNNTKVWQYEASPQLIELIENGPVRKIVKVRYPDPLTSGNSLTTNYFFYPRHIEVEQHYRVNKPSYTKWVKFFCSLAGEGTKTGFKSGPGQHNSPLVTSGKSRWHKGDWRDISYTYGFGLTAINIERNFPVWNMDSSKPREHETLYIEPFSWGNARLIRKDIRAQIAYIPHHPGRSQTNLASIFFAPTKFRISAIQDKGAPDIDTDGDTISDLDEIKRSLDPFNSDMDLDGIPDGKDPKPLIASKFLDKPKESAGRKAISTAKDLPDCRIATVGNVPALVVNGKAMGPSAYSGPNDATQWARLSKAGFRIFFIKMKLGDIKNQRFEFKRIDNTVRKLLKVVPDALVIFRIYLAPTAEFSKKYPEECLAWEGGVHAPYHTDIILNRKFGKYSFASDVWRDQATKALEKFAKHVSNSNYRQHIAGYFLGGGFPEEWNNWRRPKYLIDFSPAMTRAFRSWLQRHYKGDVNKLRAAWKDQHVSFASAQVPTRAERNVKEFGNFISPESNQRTIDYLRCHNDVLKDKLVHFSKVLKKITGGRSLVGCFYGYLQFVDYLLSGNTSFKEMLRCPTIDFWTTPPAYENRGPGDDASYRFPLNSLKNHNKLLISEDDIRTHSSGPVHFRYGGISTVEEACEVLKRSFSKNLTYGINAYWFEMNKGWYNHPRIIKLFTAMQQIGASTTSVDRSSRANIAVVVDQESLRVAPQSVSRNLLHRFPIHDLCRIGTPFDYWEIADLLALSDKKLNQYKLVIFLNAFSLTDTERDLIAKRLKNNGRHLLWLYASGLIRSPVNASLSNMKSLTGFDLEFLIKQRSQEVISTGTGNIPKAARLGIYQRPLTTGAEVDTKCTPKLIPPPWSYGVFAVADKKVMVLGRLQKGGKPGFAIKNMKNWQSIYVSSLGVPANVLRALAQNAGCHIYNDDDDTIVHASRHFLTIHTKQAGKRHITLPEKSDVYDLFEQRTVAKNVKSFDVDIPAKTTRFYYLGNASVIEEKLRQAKTDADTRLKRMPAMQTKAEKQLGETSPVRITNAGPFNLDADGFVNNFLLSAFYKTSPKTCENSLYTDYLKNETDCRPKNAYKGFDAWRAPLPIVNITAKEFARSTDQQICYYVCFYIDIPVTQKISINLGSDDGYRLWFDGKELGTFKVWRGIKVDSNKHVFNAAAGRHCIMLKIQQGGGDTGFCIRILNAKGETLKDAKIWLKPEQD
jgi:hypothetical protein